MKNLIPWSIVAVAFLTSIGLAIFGWMQLPEKVASHFDAAGQPDGWMSKTKFLAIMLAVHGFVVVTMLFVGRVMRYTPVSLLNFPNRDYWLAEQRREATIAETENMMAWIAAGSAIFIDVMFWFALEANLDQGQELNSTATWIAVGILLVWLFAFLFVRLRKYYRVPMEPA